MSDPPEPTPTPFQSSALWWARFVRDYGITTLWALLLGVILGFIPAPMFSGAKLIETDTRDATLRLETNQGVILMRLETLDRRITGTNEALDRVTCVMLLTPEQKAKLRTRVDFDTQCAWLRSGGGLAAPPRGRDEFVP